MCCLTDPGIARKLKMEAPLRDADRVSTEESASAGQVLTGSLGT